MKEPSQKWKLPWTLPASGRRLNTLRLQPGVRSFTHLSCRQRNEGKKPGSSKMNDKPIKYNTQLPILWIWLSSKFILLYNPGFRTVCYNRKHKSNAVFSFMLIETCVSFQILVKDQLWFAIAMLVVLWNSVESFFSFATLASRLRFVYISIVLPLTAMFFSWPRCWLLWFSLLLFR